MENATTQEDIRKEVRIETNVTLQEDIRNGTKIHIMNMLYVLERTFGAMISDKDVKREDCLSDDDYQSQMYANLNAHEAISEIIYRLKELCVEYGINWDQIQMLGADVEMDRRYYMNELDKEIEAELGKKEQQ